MKKSNALPALILVLIALSCEKDNEMNPTFEKINGYAQKGPYLNGTSITFRN